MASVQRSREEDFRPAAARSSAPAGLAAFWVGILCHVGSRPVKVAVTLSSASSQMNFPRQSWSRTSGQPPSLLVGEA